MKLFRRKENVVKALFILSVGLIFLAGSSMVHAASDFKVDFELSAGFNYSLVIKDGEGNTADFWTGDFGLSQEDTVAYIDTGYMLLEEGLGVWVEALDGQYSSIFSSGTLMSSLQAGIHGTWTVTETISSASVSGNEVVVQTITEHDVDADGTNPTPPAPPDPSEEGDETAEVTYPRPDPERSITEYITTLTPEQAAHFRRVVRNRRALFNGEEPESDQLTFNYEDTMSTISEAGAVPELPMGMTQMMVLGLGGVLARFRRRA
ncbi:MAG: hypothetical protein GF392_06535 [Candidatus Omnitrophica bacterium]|nr:hypothetical protein [Candidatus Omnitrophota bacterium]